MIIRVYQGGSWSTATYVGDFDFSAVPVAGQKLAIAASQGWATGKIVDAVHRIADPEDTADIALLVNEMIEGSDQSDLPLAQLDRSYAAAPSSPAKPSPWR